MTTNAYYLNTLVRLSASFVDANSVAVDPTLVTATTTDPNGLTATLSTVRDSVGHYHADLTPTVWGDWDYTFTGSGSVVAAGQHRFFVEPPSGA